MRQHIQFLITAVLLGLRMIAAAQDLNESAWSGKVAYFQKAIENLTFYANIFDSRPIIS